MAIGPILRQADMHLQTYKFSCHQGGSRCSRQLLLTLERRHSQILRTVLS